MNPLGWEQAAGNLDPSHQMGVKNSVDHASGAVNGWDVYCHYSRHTAGEPGANVGLKGDGPPSRDFHTEEPGVEDPDGQPLETDVEDAELTRKRKELREIEEQIMRKKVAIALKRVEPFMKKTAPAGVSCAERPATCKGATLKDRVNAILQRRPSAKFLLQVRSPKDKTNAPGLSEDGLLREDHPLRLRVKALMRQRCDPCLLPANRKVPDVTPSPPGQSATSPAKGDGVNQGFERFLSVLNKGVDMDLLSRIVNDDSEDLPLADELLRFPPPAVENKPDPLFRSDRQRSNSGASATHGHSRADSGDRKTDPPSQDRSLNETPSLPEDDNGEEKKNRGGLGVLSGRSKSPPAVKRKKKEEETEKPQVDEQHVQLQNILESLGLSLEAEEMSKLADRTKERLYGKKPETTRADNRGEQGSRQRGYHRHYRSSSSSSSSSSCSSSSSSSSSSSRSTSRSCSSSPSRRRRSGSRGSKRSRTPERGRPRQRSRDGGQDSKEARGHREGEKDKRETSTFEHLCPQNQPYPHPAVFSEFPDYSLSQHSEYNAYSHWMYTQGAILPSHYASRHPYPQSAYHSFPDSGVEQLEDVDLLINPDLSKSEGQTGPASGCRYLQVIRTKQQAYSCLTQVKKRRRRGGKVKIMERRKQWQQKRREEKRIADSAVKVAEAQRATEQTPEPEQPREEKRPLTEEEIKANLRKKLEAFNEKAKQKMAPPADSLTSQTG